MSENLPIPVPKSALSAPDPTFPGLPTTPAELYKYLQDVPKSGKNKMRTTLRKHLFFEAYAKSWGKVYFSCEAAGITAAGLMKWRAEPDFVEEIEHLDGLMADQIEIIVDKRILEDKSDSWLLHKLRALRPDKFTTPQANISGTITLKLDEDDDGNKAKGGVDKGNTL